MLWILRKRLELILRKMMKLFCFVVDVPIKEKSEESDIYSTMPLGMIVVRDDFLLLFL